MKSAFLGRAFFAVVLKRTDVSFTDIYVISRCSFESILSYSNTHEGTGILNIYSKEEYNQNKNKKSYSIDKRNFIENLKYFEEFYVWVDKYFPKHKVLSYTDLITDPDNTFKKEFNIVSDKNLSLLESNKFNTKRVRNTNLTKYSSEQLLKFIEITDYIQYLSRKGFLTSHSPFPIKKITLKEKINEINNFTKLLDVYNNYPSNHFEKVSLEQINDRIKLEDSIWTT